MLEPEAVTNYLQTIMALGQTLLRMLNEPDALLHNVNALADAAHSLAGSAGMLGFERLSNKGRLFERAALAASADSPALANALGLAIEDTHRAILVMMQNDVQPDVLLGQIFETPERNSSALRLEVD